MLRGRGGPPAAWGQIDSSPAYQAAPAPAPSIWKAAAGPWGAAPSPSLPPSSTGGPAGLFSLCLLIAWKQS